LEDVELQPGAIVDRENSSVLAQIRNARLRKNNQNKNIF
jgi:hypothetical protein